MGKRPVHFLIWLYDDGATIRMLSKWSVILGLDSYYVLLLSREAKFLLYGMVYRWLGLVVFMFCYVCLVPMAMGPPTCGTGLLGTIFLEY